MGERRDSGRKIIRGPVGTLPKMETVPSVRIVGSTTSTGMGRWSRRERRKRKQKKSVTIRKTKDECIAERELDEEDNIYSGTIKFIKKGYGFINIERYHFQGFDCN